jgi:hypothetical protein
MLLDFQISGSLISTFRRYRITDFPYYRVPPDEYKTERQWKANVKV